MNYLIVVAHPDDEVLGAGATIKKLTNEGHCVNLCVLSGDVKARNNRPNDNELHQDMCNALNMLGVSKYYIGEFQNIKLNIVPHLELVKFIENAIIDSNAEVIITHHPADTNNDHLHTSLAAQAAMRYFQRNDSVVKLKEFWYMEVLSSTEWSVNTSMQAFLPNLFIEVGKEGIETKIEILEQYRGVMREFPHPRSREAILGLAAYRGGQSGCNYAESFQCVFRRIDR